MQLLTLPTRSIHKMVKISLAEGLNLSDVISRRAFQIRMYD